MHVCYDNNNKLYLYSLVQTQVQGAFQAQYVIALKHTTKD